MITRVLIIVLYLCIILVVLSFAGFVAPPMVAHHWPIIMEYWQ